jgi:hypothetical protein
MVKGVNSPESRELRNEGRQKNRTKGVLYKILSHQIPMGLNGWWCDKKDSIDSVSKNKLPFAPRHYENQLIDLIFIIKFA